jgi:hypothetical protein
MATSGGERGALRVLAFLAIVGVADYLLILAALHFLRPDVNLVVEPISNYGVGPYGFLFIAAELGSAVAALALTLGLYLGMVPPARSYVGLFPWPLRRLSTAGGPLPNRCRRRSYAERHHPQHCRQPSVLWFSSRRDPLVVEHGQGRAVAFLSASRSSGVVCGCIDGCIDHSRI